MTEPAASRTIFIVRDPDGTDAVFEDVFYRTNVTALAAYAIGTGIERWQVERTALYFDELEAVCDAEDRLLAVRGLRLGTTR